MNKYNGWKNKETWAYQLNLWSRYNTCKMLESWKRNLTVTEIEQELKDYLTNLIKVAGILNQSNAVQVFLADIGDIYKIDFREIAKSIKNG